jgi:hypothetical protein
MFGAIRIKFLERQISMTKCLLVLLPLSSPGFAEDQAAEARRAAGCRPNDVQFEVKTNKDQHTMAKAESGKALVYVFGH